jgi:hypothetical protein
MTFVSAGPLHGRIRLGDELRDRFARRTQAASSSVLRYSRPDRRVLAMPSQSTSPATARCLLASAAIRLASNTKAAPVTNPSAIQRCTTVSNSLRSRSQSQNCLFLERVKWSGHLAVEAEPTEPAEGQVQVHLLAQRPFKTNTITITNQQHRCPKQHLCGGAQGSAEANGKIGPRKSRFVRQLG